MRMTTWEAVIPNDTTPIVREVGGDADDLSQYARDCEANGHHYVLYCHDQHTGPAVITMHRMGAVVKVYIRTRTVLFIFKHKQM